MMYTIIDPISSYQQPLSYLYSIILVLLLRRSLMYSFYHRSNSMPPMIIGGIFEYVSCFRSKKGSTQEITKPISAKKLIS